MKLYEAVFVTLTTLLAGAVWVAGTIAGSGVRIKTQSNAVGVARERRCFFEPNTTGLSEKDKHPAKQSRGPPRAQP